MNAITKNKLQIAYGLCKANKKSPEYTYQFLLDEVDDNDSIVINFLKKYTDYYQTTSLAKKHVNN